MKPRLKYWIFCLLAVSVGVARWWVVSITSIPVNCCCVTLISQDFLEFNVILGKVKDTEVTI